jgi:hypothetical protein
MMFFAVCKEQQQRPKTGTFRGYGVFAAPLDFQAGWSDCIKFSLYFFSFQLLIWNFLISLCTYEFQCRIGAQLRCLVGS